MIFHSYEKQGSILYEIYQYFQETAIVITCFALIMVNNLKKNNSSTLSNMMKFGRDVLCMKLDNVLGPVQNSGLRDNLKAKHLKLFSS